MTLFEQPERPSPRWLDIHTTLRHFALVNYAVPAERLRPYIPESHFEIPEFEIDGRSLALLSVVPFVDTDFRYVRLAPWLKFRFGQTNYRVYVVDRRSGEQVVWFFGTTLGSPLVYLARTVWQIPWYYGRYTINCRLEGGCYGRFSFRTESSWGAAEVELRDTGRPLSLQAGFDTLEAMRHLLTHPVRGFYHRLDGRLGSYTIWHKLMEMTTAEPIRLYFALLERLGVLSKEEMERPHSVFLCPSIDFDIHLPPKVVIGGSVSLLTRTPLVD